MKKRVVSLILIIAIIAGSVCTAAAAGGLGNFTQKNTFTKRTFTDVPQSEWYYSDVKRVYELGLVEGIGGGKFDPNGTVTVAEAITLACRLHSIYNTGKAEFEIGDPWYGVFVDYAVENGIIKSGEYTEVDRPATRYEYAKILAAALPASALPAINNVTAIPDVENTTENAHVYTLYTAGILMGNDAQGTFAPNSNVGRNEIAAIIARMADPACRKTFTLKSAPKEGDYFVRKLSDAELAGLKNADIDTLRERISTVADVVAYIDQFNAPFFTGMKIDDNSVVDVRNWLDQARNSAVAPEIYTFITLYCISDDYDGVSAVVATTETDGYYWIATALALPVENGYLLYAPSRDSAIKDNQNYTSFILETKTVQNFAGIEKSVLIEERHGMPIYHIYKATADKTNLFFSAKKEFEETTGGAELLWEMSEAEKERQKEAKIDAAWNHIMSAWSSYGLSASMAPTLSRNQVKALIGKSPQEVAAAVKTVGDCMYYYCLSGFEAKGHDLQKWISNDFWWHYNYAPEQVFEHNYGCCGSISGLTAYLLEGDYDTTGIVGMTFAAGEGGGHVINYIYDGSRYYFFDMINWVSSYYGQYLNLVSGSTLQAASDNWERTSMWTEKLIYAYEAFDGDAPVGWEWETSYISYLPNRYKDSAVILLETPSEGYVYKWVDVPENVWNSIADHRNGK